jgi:hypothetical protein
MTLADLIKQWRSYAATWSSEALEAEDVLWSMKLKERAATARDCARQLEWQQSKLNETTAEVTMVEVRTGGVGG